MLGGSIFGTKCDRDKPFFLHKEGVNQIIMKNKITTHLDRKSQKLWLSFWNIPTSLRLTDRAFIIPVGGDVWSLFTYQTPA